MRNLMKLIAITAMTALMLFALITCACADEKIYTSPSFTLPLDRLEKAEEILEAQEQAAAPEAQEETAEPGEEDPDEGEDPAEDEGFEELDDDAGEVTGEPVEEKRRVVIKSSQGAIVTEGDQITLTSELYGFGEHLVEYQWQVDKGEGAGWEDINGGDRYKYTFIANRETIRYSWRLIVNVIDE
ncbi:MAG: hypothetical protein K6F61_07390 [Clostridiales bacterium]|nr:hypothetical protein [Clostridiales bacterium]